MNANVEMKSILMEEFDSEERKLEVEILAKRNDGAYTPQKIEIKFTVNWELMARYYAQWCYDNPDRPINICDDAITAQTTQGQP